MGSEPFPKAQMAVRMSEHINQIEGLPADVNLMLRAHAELRCLSREVIPVLRQVETKNGLPDEQLGAAMAYLEVTWIEAQRRAAETDLARRELATSAQGALPPRPDEDLHGRACRYYDAVKALRETAARRIAPALSASRQDLGQLRPELGPACGT